MSPSAVLAAIDSEISEPMIVVYLNKNVDPSKNKWKSENFITTYMFSWNSNILCKFARKTKIIEFLWQWVRKFICSGYWNLLKMDPENTFSWWKVLCNNLCTCFNTHCDVHTYVDELVEFEYRKYFWNVFPTAYCTVSNGQLCHLQHNNLSTCFITDCVECNNEPNMQNIHAYFVG